MRLLMQGIDEDENEQTISGVKREDWENMSDPVQSVEVVNLTTFQYLGVITDYHILLTRCALTFGMLTGRYSHGP